jgi:hypothetical protein
MTSHHDRSPAMTHPHDIPDDGTWAIVELADGRTLAGFCRPLRGGRMAGVEVDVPAVDGSPGLLAIHAARSIAVITPCSKVQAESVALARRPLLGASVHPALPPGERPPAA